LGEAYFADHVWSLVALQRFGEEGEEGERKEVVVKEDQQTEPQRREGVLTTTAGKKVSWHAACESFLCFCVFFVFFLYL
jgi:hypothetical protein